MSIVRKSGAGIWTTEEEVKLVGMIESKRMKKKDVAIELGRSPSSIYQKVTKLKNTGLYKERISRWYKSESGKKAEMDACAIKPSYTHWTRDEEVYLVGMIERGGLTLAEVADDLKRDLRSVQSKVCNLKRKDLYKYRLKQWDAES